MLHQIQVHNYYDKSSSNLIEYFLKMYYLNHIFFMSLSEVYIIYQHLRAFFHLQHETSKY